MDVLVRPVSPTNNALAHAVLTAMSHVGNKDDLGAVAAIAMAEAKDDKTATLRRAAEKCLAAIKARIEENQKSKTLLRPSQSDDSGLLRAASASTSTESQQALLRPHE